MIRGVLDFGELIFEVLFEDFLCWRVGVWLVAAGVPLMAFIIMASLLDENYLIICFCFSMNYLYSFKVYC